MRWVYIDTIRAWYMVNKRDRVIGRIHELFGVFTASSHDSQFCEEFVSLEAAKQELESYLGEL